MTEVHRIVGLGTGVVSRLCDSGELVTNGKKGRSRRIDPASVTQLELKLASEKRVKIVKKKPLT